MTRWVALRSKQAIIGEVRTASRSNAWLAAQVSWGCSSVEGIVSRDQWESEQAARRAKAAAEADKKKEQADRRLLREIEQRVAVLQHYG